MQSHRNILVNRRSLETGRYILHVVFYAHSLISSFIYICLDQSPACSTLRLRRRSMIVLQDCILHQESIELWEPLPHN